MQSPTEINLRRVLVGHRAAVNVVDFDEKYIVSASGDRTIKVTIQFKEISFYSFHQSWFQRKKLHSDEVSKLNILYVLTW